MTFALYNASFTKTASSALSTLESAGEEAEKAAMEKRWEFLKKFDKNFEHWYVIDIFLYLA